MSKNVRFHLASLKNGHKNWQYMIPAQNATDVRLALETENIKVGAIEYSDWHVAQAFPSNETGGVAFTVNINGQDFVYEQAQYGYDYLVSQYPVEYNEVIDYLNGNRY